jgi:hypothetical protein
MSDLYYRLENALNNGYDNIIISRADIKEAFDAIEIVFAFKDVISGVRHIKRVLENQENS